MLADRRDISQIAVIDRHRSDFGDLAELAASIRENGLIQPVVVSLDGRLVAGQRRLEACKFIGWTDVPVHVVRDVQDAAHLIRMERDENVCRKEMTPSEKISLGRALEELERPKAREAQSAAGRAAVAVANGETTAFVQPNESSERFDTREVVAPAVGMSSATYSRAKALVVAAEQGDEIAADAVAEMDRTGKPYAAHERWKKEHAAKTEAPPQPVAQPVERHKLLRKTHHIKAERVISQTVSAFEGARMGIDLIDADDIQALAPADAHAWAESLTHSVRSINRLIKELRNVNSNND